jgi:hypothetical protein
MIPSTNLMDTVQGGLGRLTLENYLEQILSKLLAKLELIQSQQHSGRRTWA